MNKNGKYITKVIFTETNKYGCGPEDENDVYTIEEFREHIKSFAFIDYDGHGYPVKNSLADHSITVKPSTFEEDLPNDATHIVWYNR